MHDFSKKYKCNSHEICLRCLTSATHFTVNFHRSRSKFRVKPTYRKSSNVIADGRGLTCLHQIWQSDKYWAIDRSKFGMKCDYFRQNSRWRTGGGLHFVGAFY